MIAAFVLGKEDFLGCAGLGKISAIRNISQGAHVWLGHLYPKKVNVRIECISTIIQKTFYGQLV